MVQEVCRLLSLVFGLGLASIAIREIQGQADLRIWQLMIVSEDLMRAHKRST